MKSSKKIGLILLAAAVLVTGFVVSRPDNKDKSTQAGQPAKSSSQGSGSKASANDNAPEGADSSSAQNAAAVTPAETDDLPVLEAGSLKKITVHKDQQVNFYAASKDEEDEIHVHGYDIARDVPAGGRVKVSFKASETGVFEIELHGADTQVAKLTVLP